MAVLVAKRVLWLVPTLWLIVGSGLPVVAVPFVVEAKTPGSEPNATAVSATLTLELRKPAGDKEDWKDRSVPMEIPGSVEIDLPPHTTWRLLLTSARYWSAPKEFEVAEGGRVRLALYPTGEVRGLLATSKDPPPEGVQAHFMPTITAFTAKEPEPTEGEVPCELAAGTVRCSLPAGVLDFQLRAEGYAPLYFWEHRIRADGEEDLGRLRFARGASLIGRVVDEEGRPIAGAEVSLDPYMTNKRTDALYHARFRKRVFQTETDVRGFFQLNGLSPGAYRLKATKHGYSPALDEEPIVFHEEVAEILHEPVTLFPPAQLVVNLTPPLDPFGQPWRIELKESDVEVGQWGQDFSGSASPEGQWRQTGVNPGLYWLQVFDREESRWLAERVEVVTDQPELFFDLPLIGVVGTVTCDGEPVPGTLRLSAGAGPQQVSFEVDEEGELAGFMPDERWWWVEMLPADQEGVVLSLDRIEVDHEPADEVVELAIEVPDTRLEGIVTDSRGQPVAAAEVAVSHPVKPGAELRGRHATSSIASQNDGTFEIRGLRPGIVGVRATAGERASANVRVDLGEDLMPPFLRLELRENVRFTVEVLSPQGPLSGAFVAAMEDPRGNPRDFPVSGGVSWGMTGPHGTVSLEISAPAGLLLIMAKAPGFGGRLLREQVEQNCRLPVHLDTSYGTLVIDLTALRGDASQPHGGEVLIHEAVAIPLGVFRGLAIPRPPPGAQRFEVPEMASGWYALCVGRTASVAAARAAGGGTNCSSGFLPPHGELVLTAPQTSHK